MKHIRYIVLLVALALAALGIFLNIADSRGNESRLSEIKEVTLADGTRCVINAWHGGIACDWKH